LTIKKLQKNQIQEIINSNFSECAKTGKVNYVISNDNHLLKLKEFEGIKIITPSDFLKTLYKKKFNTH